jgi:hypothetical protein
LLILAGISGGLVVKKIAWCLWLVLAMPSMAFSFERRDGAYYCTSKFLGSVAYNDSLKRWEGKSFDPSVRGSFVVKLNFRGATKVAIGSVNYDRDEYDVTITNEGNSVASSCLELNGKPPLIDEHAFLRCNEVNGVYEYKFNFDKHRFVRISTAGYLNGADSNDNMPTIAGGLCTKIQ